MPRVAAQPIATEDEAAEKKRQKQQMILSAAKMGSIELQADSNIRLQLPHSPPMPRCAARPFAAAIRRRFPSMKITDWDGDDDGKLPTAFSMPQALVPDYLQWARSLGVSEDKLQLPPWLAGLVETKEELQEAIDEKEPDFFSEPKSHELMEYQRQGIKFGIRRGGRVLIADDMGLGKTVQALGIAWEYRESFPMLIVCPSSLRNVWEDQIQRWLGLDPETVQIIFSGSTPIESTARIVVVSYALLGKSEQLQTFHGKTYKLVISDERHYIKNPDAQRSQALLKVAGAAERVILVSGTPILNSAMELYPLLQILDPKIADKHEFARRYFGGINTDFGKTKYIDPRREEELHAYLFKTVGIRRKKEQVLSQLPPKTRQTIPLAASSPIGKLKAMEDKLFKFAGEDAKKDPKWWADLRTASHFLMEAKKRSVGEYITDVLDNGIGKFLLFAHHKEMLDSLENVLKERVGGGGYIRIDGSMSSQRQRADLKRFQEDRQCHGGLLSITALAEGQTITNAKIVIFAELVWTPSTIDQCEGRAHRSGQQRSVLIQYLLLQDSEVDRRCYQRLEETHQHAAKVLDNNESAFVEETVDQEKAKRMAGQVLGDRPDRRPKPFTSYVAYPKAQAEPVKAEGLSVQKAVEQKFKSVPNARSSASKSTPSAEPAPSLPLPDVESYKILDHLHLGLNVKIGATYSRQELEARCKGNAQKLGRLRFHFRDLKKLQRVDSGSTKSTESTREPPSKKPRTDEPEDLW